MLVTALDKKLIRDLMHMRGQAFAIALVIAAGVATLILATGAYSSLEETRRTYYERYRFADIFAQARRAPDYLKERLRQIPGVSAVETRIVFPVLLDIEGMEAPASGRLISLPRFGAPVLNGLFMRSGRMPDPNRDDEIIVNEPFAKANHFQPGSKLKAILNGRKRELTVVGIALSPEFIYALATGELVPDDKRFGVLWMPHEAAAGAFDLDGAFNDVSLKLRRDARPAEVMERVDTLLEPFGGTDAYARKDQQSHAFLDSELTQLEAMAYVIPPIFLAVAAFLLNMTLARIIALEREQIGLLKALGYKRVTIALHYTKFAGLIAIVGIVIGFAGGTWLGGGLTRLYAEFYHFPFLVYLYSVKVYVVAGGVSMAAALFGALRAVRDAINLPPAVAMAAPVPVRYKQTWISHLALIKRLSQTTRMILRHLIRYPVRSLMTTLGIASSVALLITSLFTLDSIDFMIDVTYFQTKRQDITVTFNEIKSINVAQAVQRLPGVLDAEVSRSVPVTMRNGSRSKRLALSALPQNGRIQQLLDKDLKPVAVPDVGVAITEKLAEILDAHLGDRIIIDVHYGKRKRLDQPVTAILQGYLGLEAFMALEPMNAALGDGRAVSSADMLADDAKVETLYTKLKEMPAVSGITLMKNSLQMFRDTLAENMNIMTMVYVVLAAIIAFGVVYNSARIQLSERGRELASLRVLGFTRGEVAQILLGEVAILVVLAIPLGWVLGYWLAAHIVQGLDTELFRVPLIVSRYTYTMAALVVIAAAIFSAFIIKHRINRLDLIAVLKTRE